MEGFEFFAQLTGTLTGPQQQHAAGLQSKMKQGQDLFLCNPAEVDQQIAAGDQMQAGEWSVLHEVVRREDNHLADLGRDLVARVCLREISVATRR